MTARDIANKLIDDIRRIDHRFWQARGSQRIAAAEYYRKRRHLAKAYTRAVGFLDFRAQGDDR